MKRFFKSLLAVLLVLVLALAAFLFLFPKQPKDAACDWARKKDNTTILLVGTDKAADNTDTIMLLNIDRASRAIHLMSIPRDTRVDSSYWPHKINGAYSANGGGEDGIEALMGYVTDCVGFRPDGYVMIDLSCFIDLVDLFGGVEFNVPQDMFYDDPAQDLHIALNAGEQTLDGEQAMGLVRYRYGYTMADLDRVNVQRAFIQAAIEQWAKPKKRPAAAARAVRRGKALHDGSFRAKSALAGREHGALRHVEHADGDGSVLSGRYLCEHRGERRLYLDAQRPLLPL